MNTYYTHIAYSISYGIYCNLLHIFSNRERSIRFDMVYFLYRAGDIFQYMFIKHIFGLYTLSPLGKLCDVYADNTGYYLLVPIEVKI